MRRLRGATLLHTATQTTVACFRIDSLDLNVLLTAFLCSTSRRGQGTTLASQAYGQRELAVDRPVKNIQPTIKTASWATIYNQAVQAG